MVKTKQYLLCNRCSDPVVDLTKAFKISGTIGKLSAAGLETVVTDADAIYHDKCLAQILGMNTFATPSTADWAKVMEEASRAKYKFSTDHTGFAPLKEEDK